MPALELLAPARNLEIGLAALRQGADAIYIGADRFGARAAAGNPVKDIEQLASFAHLYKARVYVTLNTLPTDFEIEEVLKTAREVYEAGADALIIQDLGLLEAGLPPLPVHASTQMHNATPEKVRFLEQAGFSQVVLARELSLEAIKNIRKVTTIPLEFFVHGALCICYSGHCHLSQYLTGRSANRGECTQPCRSYYNLCSKEGKILEENKYLLSPRDLNLAVYLEDLAQAGISSFKIEGRLKDIHYVRNITAFYRSKLDELMLKHPAFTASSSGSTEHGFEPDPSKTFNRGFTSYNLSGKRDNWLSEYPKSKGQFMGEIKNAGNGWFTLFGDHDLAAGDGILIEQSNGEWSGARIFRTEEYKVYAGNTLAYNLRAKVYRNDNPRFEKEVQNAKTRRQIKVRAFFSETPEGFVLKMKDEDGNFAETVINSNKEPARQQETALKNLQDALCRSGESPFHVEIALLPDTVYHFKPSVLNGIRREVLERLAQIRIKKYQPIPKKWETTHPAYPAEETLAAVEITNRYTEQFYRHHGVAENQISNWKSNTPADILMTTLHCLKYEIKACNRHPEHKPGPEPAFLENQGKRIYLKFDCNNCLMQLHPHSDYGKV